MAGAPNPPIEEITSRRQLIDTRRKRYTAQALELFEEALEKPLRRKGLLEDAEIRDGVETAKAMFRRKLSDLGTDAIEIMYLADRGIEMNDYASETIESLRR